MNKNAIFGLGVLALGAAGAGTMVYSGSAIEKNMTTETRAKLDKLAPLVKITDLKYDKSFTGATRTLSLQIGCDAKPLKLTWRDHIKHGPMPGFSGLGAATVDSELVLSDETKKQLKEQLGLNAPPLTVKSRVGFGGDITSDFAMPALAHKLPDGTQLNWQGFTGHSVQSGDVVKFDSSLPSLEIVAPDKSATIKLTGMKMNGNTSIGKYWWASLGTSEGEIASMEILGKHENESVNLVMRDIRMKSNSTLEGELMSSGSTMTGTVEFGKVKFEKASMTASFARLHAPTLETFVGALLSKEGMNTLCADAKKADAGEPGDDSEFAKALGKAAQDMLPKLLQYNPEYKLENLSGTYLGKEGVFAYSVGTQGVSADEAKNIASNPTALIKRLVASASMRLPVTWIRAIMIAKSGEANAPSEEALAAMIEPAVAQGMVKREGDFLVLKANLKDGKAQLNGKDIPLPGMAPAAN